MVGSARVRAPDLWGCGGRTAVGRGGNLARLAAADNAIPEGAMADLRIAVYHDLPSGGAKRTAFEQARGLAERGFELTAFLPRTAEESFLPLGPLVRETRWFDREAPPDRERALTAPRPAVLLRWARFLAGVVRSEREIARAIDDAGFDAALVHPSQFTQAPLVLRHLRTPAVYYCQEPLRAAHEPRIAPPLLRFGIRHTLGRLDRSTARKADVLVANSAFMGGRLAAIYDVRPEVVSPGVDAARFHPAAGARQPFVLAVGGLHPLKGFDFLVRALAALPPDARPPLLIVSDRERKTERARIDALAGELAVVVDYRFRVSEEELVELYGTARAVLVASHDEPFGLVPLEAMACATPVIVVAEGGLRETVDDGRTGLLAPRDPAAFAARLRTLLEDPGSADAMGAAGRRDVVDRWTWGHAHDRFADILRRTARKQP